MVAPPDREKRAFLARDAARWEVNVYRHCKKISFGTFFFDEDKNMMTYELILSNLTGDLVGVVGM